MSSIKLIDAFNFLKKYKFDVEKINHENLLTLKKIIDVVGDCTGITCGGCVLSDTMRTISGGPWGWVCDDINFQKQLYEVLKTMLEYEDECNE